MNTQPPLCVALLAATLLLIPFTWTGCAANGQNTPNPTMENQNDSLSYALGVLFATNVTNQGIKDYAPAQIAQAFADVQSGNPAMTPDQANELVRQTLIIEPLTCIADCVAIGNPKEGWLTHQRDLCSDSQFTDWDVTPDRVVPFQAAQGSRITFRPSRRSRLVTTLGVFSRRVAGAADLADPAIAASCRAVLSAVINDLQVQRVPARFRKSAFQVPLGFDHVPSSGQPPSLRKTVDMSVHWKGRQSKCLGHHHARSFVTHSW